MKLREFSKPFGFKENGKLVTYEVSNAVGMCAQRCNNCHCLVRIVQGCVALGIGVPPHDPEKNHPRISFTMTEEKLLQLRDYLGKQPHPDIW